MFGAPQKRIRPTPHIQDVRPIQNLEVSNNEGIFNNQGQKVLPQPLKHPIYRVVEGDLGRKGPEIVLVNRNQDVGQIISNVQQNNFGGQNNITNIVE